MTIYCGREFSCDEIESIRQLMLQSPTLLRTPLSRKLCELFAWTKPNGELKDMSCRVALLRMQAHGLITLPPSRMPRRGPPPTSRPPPPPMRKCPCCGPCTSSPP